MDCIKTLHSSEKSTSNKLKKSVAMREKSGNTKKSQKTKHEISKNAIAMPKIP
jgi:hypothetical protein